MGGIIPARAGFTLGEEAYRRAGSDHPRSRGVYDAVTVYGDYLTGSSPLARGLRGLRLNSGVGLRIIPARAGFTGRAPARPCGRPDHPRSRGVYSVAGALGRLRLGSSPLARGLLSVTTIMLRDVGIIPARAGFTGGGRWWSCGVPDHPRSRGVYVVLLCTCGPRRGSSPLARGLRHRRHRTPAAPRIIPARAGFTSPSGQRRENA